MTKQNYIAISKIINHQLRDTHFIIPLVNTLSNYFADDNPRFNKNKFIEACLKLKEE